jgi:hypothetical protein
MSQSSATFYTDPPRRSRRRAQLPRGMREERERLQARRDKLARVLEFGHYWIPRATVARYETELAAVEKRLSGFDAFRETAQPACEKPHPWPSYLCTHLRWSRPRGRGPARLRMLECSLHPRADLVQCPACRRTDCTKCHPERCSSCGRTRGKAAR